jgi:putative endonuclease
MARARWAEDLVARFYERSGYEIVARNWHCREGELDIVAILVSPVCVMIAIVEVKARATNNYGSPFEAVTQVKQKKLRIAATKFLASRRDLHGEIRFDVVAVLGTQLEVLHNAF